MFLHDWQVEKKTTASRFLDLTIGQLLSSINCLNEVEERKGSVEAFDCNSNSNSDYFVPTYGKDVRIVAFAKGKSAMRFESLTTPVAPRNLSEAIIKHIGRGVDLYLDIYIEKEFENRL